MSHCMYIHILGWSEYSIMRSFSKPLKLFQSEFYVSEIKCVLFLLVVKKKKVKLYLSTPRRRIGGVDVWLHSFEKRIYITSWQNLFVPCYKTILYNEFCACSVDGIRSFCQIRYQYRWRKYTFLKYIRIIWIQNDQTFLCPFFPIFLSFVVNAFFSCSHLSFLFLGFYLPSFLSFPFHFLLNASIFLSM